MFSVWYGLLKIKRFNKKTQADKVKAFKIANNPKYDGYQRGLASMIYKFFDKKSKGSKLSSSKWLHKPIIRKFKKKEKFIHHLAP